MQLHISLLKMNIKFIASIMSIIMMTANFNFITIVIMICGFLLMSHFVLKKLVMEHCTKIVDGKKSIVYKSENDECQTSKIRIDSITCLTMYMSSELSYFDMLKLRFKKCEQCKMFFIIHQGINIIINHLILIAIIKFSIKLEAGNIYLK